MHTRPISGLKSLHLHSGTSRLEIRSSNRRDRIAELETGCCAVHFLISAPEMAETRQRPVISELEMTICILSSADAGSASRVRRVIR